MLKTELLQAVKISTKSMEKLGKNKDVRAGVLWKIYIYLGYKIDDIMDIIPEE